MIFRPFSDTREALNRWGKAGQPFLFLTSYDLRQAYAARLDEIEPGELRYDFRGQTNWRQPVPPATSAVTWETVPPTFEAYRAAFDIVAAHLRRGDSFLTNLTFRSGLHTDLDLPTLFDRTKAPYRLWAKDRFVCFSPEPFVRVEGRRVVTFPMKGTISAAAPDALEQLMDHPKEAAEHATIVDLMRNDLSQVADGVRVERYRYAERIRTLRGDMWTTSSEIAGRLTDRFHTRYGDLLAALLPAGSVTGAPKPATCAAIAEAEPVGRGFYTGVCGLFDGHRFDSAVMIRFVSQEGDGLYFHSGGGITALSDARAEYDELILKTHVPFR